MKKIFLLTSLIILCFLGKAQTDERSGVPGGQYPDDPIIMGTDDCNSLIFKTNNTQRIFLSRDGAMLGIGKSEPSAALDLFFESSYCSYKPGSTIPINPLFPMLRMSAPRVSGNFTTSFDTRNGTITMAQSSNAALNILGYSNNKIVFEPAGALLLESPRNGGIVVASDGNVGIGSNPPQAKLDVAGSFKAENATITETITTNTLSAETATIPIITDNTNVTGTLTANALSAQSGKINGLLCVKEIRVQLTGTPCWPDFVFAKDYKLLPLKDVEQYIIENQHLPNVPSSAEVEANGVELGAMNAMLLQKVEELTLYIIQMEKRLSEIENMKGGK